MKTTQMTVVRIYLSESDGKLEPLIKRLHDWEKVRGVTVFRGISGFGRSGELHTAKLVDLSLDLPIVVEFFDEPEKVKAILEHISENIIPRHILWWTALVNESE